jgi:ornithine lipid ester-linked acyl 2-hydroxylase
MNAMNETRPEAHPARPERLNHPIRKRVKRWGKRLTRRMARHQARASLVPDTPFLDPALFPDLEPVRARWQEIEAETRGVLRYRDAIPGFEEISPDQYRIAKERSWKTFVLYGFGERLEAQCAQMPVTAEVLSRVPNLRVAWLSILAPGYHIPAHSGVTKGILRAHLGLIVPSEREKCRIRVGDQIRPWAPGELLVLDDTYEHEVWNETDEERVILLFDFDRPMRWSGRLMNRVFLSLIRFSAFYRDPLKNSKDAEKRFEEAIKRADAAIEGMSDPS